HLDLPYAKVKISVRLASIGVKKTYTRQRTLASRAVTGSLHQWSMTMYTGEKYVVQLELNQYPLRTPIRNLRRSPSGLHGPVVMTRTVVSVGSQRTCTSDMRSSA